MGRIKIFSFLGLLVILFCLAGCSSYDNAISQKEGASDTKKNEVYNVNEPFVFENLEYTVLGFEESKKYNGKETENKFVIVTVNVKNKGKEPVTIDNNFFVLIDENDRIFKSDATRDISLFDDEYFSSVNSINPGLSKTGRVSFEVPEESTTFMLGIRDNMFDFGGADYRYVTLKSN